MLQSARENAAQHKKNAIKEIFTAKMTKFSYNIAMTKSKKIAGDISSSPSDVENIAEEYLNLWQQNLKCWASDPDALEKWVKGIEGQIK